MVSAHCPALMITAPQSDSGKTTVVAAMARYWRNQGKVVRVFKTGPDFIDPKFHEFASGAPCHQLDLTMMGAAACRRHLHAAAQQADLILIEGVMGMYDGPSSSAKLAQQFGVPLLAVINAAKMAQTFGAIAHGLATYQSGVDLFGVVANRVGSAGHGKMLQDSLPESIAFCGWLPRSEALALPERHLGLVQADEMEQLDCWLDGAAKLLSESCDMPLPQPVEFAPQQPCPQRLANATALAGKTIAVAQDLAFGFIYHDNLALLRDMGAQLSFFSPLSSNALPQADALYLPGGYPELHQQQLLANTALIDQIRQFAASNKPIVAECGGMLYLLDELTDIDGVSSKMLGLLPGKAAMQPKLQGIGMLTATFSGDDNGVGAGAVNGHCFHYSKTDIAVAPLTIAKQPHSARVEEGVYQHGSILASYVHWYFGSCPQLVAQWFGASATQGDGK
ncbi:cobyrinate a,c-diamide synthase [Ferrimonas lipolytica]|uniref:Cobyrinate a,c-diamide synthase n=1 Tax=Ferrimonas lipolytica TaxID=2724191 RepID=A0A6H1UB38_9GAMM|nr:cobyrinate a,c-diamide synthase [Ferrimonas lipolytica]QIZ76271.1 cobyrinate a,c-diamide synthase [Ferrimonas lipolytica]